MAKQTGVGRTFAVNRRAHYDYDIEETFEAGLALSGSEVKSIREGRVNLREGFVRPVDSELYLWNVHISPWQPAGPFGHEPERPRKLLLHKDEIAYIIGKLAQKGYTCVPLRLYEKDNRIKVEIGLGRGKKAYDKRRDEAEREAKRRIQEALKRRV
jgi:SsrA-binding protein